MQRVYLARHATPDWNRRDLPYHLPPGPPLVEVGLQEAAQLADFFKAARVRKIYASPLERCAHTAEIAGDSSGAEVEVHPELREWQPGEKPAHILERYLPFFERAAEESEQDGPVALIIHGGPIAMLLIELGMAPDTLESLRVYDNKNPVPPGGAWEARREVGEEAWKLRLVFVPGEGGQQTTDDGRLPEKDG